MVENLKKLNSDEVYIKEDFLNEFNDTLWNTKQTKVYDDKKYKECVTKFYLKQNHPNEVVIYSRNVKSEPDFRRIIVKFNDGEEREIIQEFGGYGEWSYMVLPNNIEKMLVYDRNELLYEEHFKDIINVIDFY
jgi:predicted DNA-binding transcriptional regulator YafY